jgi:hypothetical protein
MRLRSLIPFTLAFAAVGSLVLVRNVRVFHAWIPSANPSQDGLATNAVAALTALFGGWVLEETAGYQIQVLLAGMVLLGLGFVLVRQHRLGAVCHDVWLAGPRYLPILWAVAYVGCLNCQRTRVHFDEIDARLILPAGAALMIPAAAFWGGAFPPAAVIGVALIVVLTVVGEPRGGHAA